jgi:serine/threonine protein phosphatase PrpC
MVSQEPPSVFLTFGAHAIPEASRKIKGGEDAYFSSGKLQAFGIADGVGSWNLKGIDSGIFTKTFISYVMEVIRTDFPFDVASSMSPAKKDQIQATKRALKCPSLFRCFSLKGSDHPIAIQPIPVQIMQAALEQVQQKKIDGSSTAVVGVVRGRHLTIANLGDSGFIQLRLIANASSRSYEIVFKTTPQLLKYNNPFQIGYDSQSYRPSDSYHSPLSSAVHDLHLEVGDIVIATSDGLLDNLSDDHVVTVVNNFDGDASGLAQKLALKANEHSLSTTIITPWSTLPRPNGRTLPGGKRDDIAVVVGFAVPHWDRDEMDRTNGLSIE